MTEESRYLITTADEGTWKFDRPVIFLGEWCCIYDRRQIWQHMDAIVSAPYGLGQARKDIDFAYTRAAEQELFPVLCSVLNQHHATRHGVRYWLIVLGHWFRRFVATILNRVRTLEQCIQTHKISGTTIYVNDIYQIATPDSLTAIYALDDDRWNNALNARILELLELADFPLEVVKGVQSTGFRRNATNTQVSLIKNISKWGYRKAIHILTSLAGEEDAFIIRSYLSKMEEIKLQLALGQVPQVWTCPSVKFTDHPNRALRLSLSTQIAQRSSNAFSNLLRSMVFELLPVCYLEDFEKLTKEVQKLPWPNRPKFIFTSNAFDTDEVFKLWAATKVESGSKYVVGQHGNNYSTHRYLNPTVEEVTTDKFLTWGWTDGLEQHTPAFLFKSAGGKAAARNPTGGLLLIEVCIDHRITTWDSTAEFGDYFKDQQTFIRRLDDAPKKHLTVRLHAGYRNQRWSEEARWQAFDPLLKIDTGEAAISRILAKSRLVVYSYDSTGILETLSQNIPTLAFWPNGFEHLRESAKPYYQFLVDAGIVHLTPDSAAQKINEVWDDVEDWWAQRAVQEACVLFCNRFARKELKRIQKLRIILHDEPSRCGIIK